jgi:hypothetical protein
MIILKRFSILLIALLFVVGLSLPAGPVWADQLEDVSDTLSTATQGVAANHTIVFTTPTGVANGETITLTFDADLTMGAVEEDDFDIAGSVLGEGETAANCDAADEISIEVAAQVATFTLCAGDGATFGAAETVTIEIGLNATYDGTGNAQITNPVAAEVSQIDIGGTQVDSASLAVVTVEDDSVAVTATVDPSITFSISDTTIGFGDLSASVGRWATGTTGTNASEAMPDAAHTMVVSTNADNGYAITYNGATLTATGGEITVAAVDEDSDGTQDSEEFGISASASVDATIAEGYLRDAAADFTFVASTTTTLVSELGPTTTETISVSYLANIAGDTEAGSYSTSITYIATATF